MALVEVALGDAAEEQRCRLCYRGEEEGPLVQLCACRGSAKLVHRRCLEKWRRTSPKEDAAYRCGECKDHYRDALSLELLSARLQAERTDGEDTGFTSSYLPWACSSCASLSKVKLVPSPSVRLAWSRALRSSRLSASRYSSLHSPQR